MMSRWHNLAVVGLLASLLPVSLSPAAELDSLVPSDAELVLHLNVKQVLDSALVKKYALDPIKKALQSPKAAEAFEATGVDPLRDLDSITIAGCSKDNRVLIVVRGRFDADKFNTFATEQAKKDSNIKSSQEGKLIIWEGQNPGQHALFSTVSHPGTWVISTDKAYLVKSITEEGKSKPCAELRAVVSKVSGNESLWVAGIITPEIKAKLESNPQSKKYAETVRSATACLTLTQGMQFNLQVHTTDPKVAEELRTSLDKLKPLLQVFAAQMGAGNEQQGALFKEVIEAIKLTTQATTFNIDLMISEDLFNKIREVNGIQK